MESSRFFKLFRNTTPTTSPDVTFNINDDALFGTDDEFTDDDDSLFDLEINSPNAENSNKEFQFIESPRDVFLNKNDSKPSSPLSFLRSTPKLKLVFFGFRKSTNSVESKATSQLGQSGRFEEQAVVKDNSLRCKLLKESAEYEYKENSVPKYAKLMKNFTTKKANVNGSVSPLASPVRLSPRRFSEGSRMNSFKMVSKSLGKSRSAVEAAALPVLRRRDDCLLDDAIQGAILHCKKSQGMFPQLSRSASDPAKESTVL